MSYGPSIEEIVRTQLYGGKLLPEEWRFIELMRRARKDGVGYGFMQQVIEWEWAHNGPGSWGPNTHAKEVERLEARIDQLEDAIRWALGEGDSDFGENFVIGKGPFQWRGELRERAGMVWDREQLQSVARQGDEVEDGHGN